jgi:EAL domain-containing protein (putative c-di-GMP-specific phosphodiesterase class I)
MNVSGSTATDPRWFNQLTEIIAANQSVADRLTVEITETIALGDLKETFSFVEALRNIGCSVAIDDFGAGFTSFRNLRDLPVNIVKLDGSFCRGLKHNAANQYLVRTLIDLTHKFDLKTIAEWVETPEDAEILKDANVDLMQGNLFGEAAVELPWARKEERGFASAETASQITAAGEEAKVFIHNPPATPPAPDDVAEMTDNYEMEEGLSRLKLAIKALDDQFRSSPVFSHELPLAEAG